MNIENIRLEYEIALDYPVSYADNDSLELNDYDGSPVRFSLSLKSPNEIASLLRWATSFLKDDKIRTSRHGHYCREVIDGKLYGSQ